MIRQGLTRRLKAMARQGWYPILLPGCRIVDGGISKHFGPTEHRSPEVLAALAMCDGSRTLAEVCRATGIGGHALAEQEEVDTVLLWPRRAARVDASMEAKSKDADVIISPHLDDAALSLGALMLSADSKLVVDVFSKVSWWRFELRDELLPRVQETRDAEEELVMRLTGAMVRRWGLGEAPLRGYPLKEIFTTSRSEEAAGTHATIREAVCELARERESLTANWYLPLGIGNHIDHRIARDAALDGLRDAGMLGNRVRFYEDLPYAAEQEVVGDHAAFLEKVMPGSRLRSESAVARENALDLKQRLLRVYASQLTASQILSVVRYARRAAGGKERVWRFDDETLKRTDGKIPALAKPD